MTKNKKKREKKKNQTKFKKPSSEDYARGRLGIYSIIVMSAIVAGAIFYLVSKK